MDIAEIINQLSDPAAYPDVVDGPIVVCQTHISVVFLAGEFAYKLKKPVDLGFVDYSTLARREHFCRREVELNRRLAPDVYLDAVPVTMTGSDLQVAGQGEVVEWAVKMRRLPDRATLESRLADNEVDVAEMVDLAKLIADFHARAARGDEVAEFGRFEVVAQNARDNYTQTEDHVGETVDAAVHARLAALNDDELARLHDLIDERARRHVPCDTHGDLRLDHVYRVDGAFVIVDCIEFNDRFRYADPISDIAFLVMDLDFVGRRDLSGALADAYIRASGDAEGAALLPFYVAYRAAVRAKVEGIKAAEAEIDDTARDEARRKARAHWLLALGRLEAPRRRPALVLVGGLPGTGKSTLAHTLAERANFTVIDTDVVRKELAGIDPHTSGRAAFGQGIYTAEWSAKTYAECLRRAQARLQVGERVIVDATFTSEARRAIFLECARHYGVPGLFLVCETSSDTAQARLDARTGDVSDAGWDIYRKMAEAWEAPSADSARVTHALSAEGSVDEVVERALGVLRSLELL